MTVTSLRVELQAQETVRLPRYKGAVFRGGFGLAFRRVACPFPRRECADCLLKDRCVWSYVFNSPTPPDAPVMSRADAVPHPYIVEPPDDDATEFPIGAELTFNLILVGRAIEHVPYFILTFEQMAEQGLGPGRGRLAVAGVWQNGELFYDARAKSLLAPVRTTDLAFRPDGAAANRVMLRFLTPTQIMSGGRMARRISFQILVRALLRRIWLLSSFHDRPVEIDHKSLIDLATHIKATEMILAGDEYRWFSGRQGRSLEKDGVTGTVTYEGDIGPFLPFLRAGELLHVGKGTSFGMGKYKMEVG